MATKQTTSAALEASRKALVQLQQEASGLDATRDAALLDGAATPDIAKIDQQIETTRHAVLTERRRVELLEAQAAKEEAERQAKLRADTIAQIEAQWAEHEKDAGEIQVMVGQLQERLRAFVARGERIDESWPWLGHDRQAMCLPREFVLEALRNEFFRISEPPALGEAFHRTPVNLPGSKNPKPLEWALQPEKTTPFVERFKQGRELAMRIMATGVGSSGKADGVAVVDGVPTFAMKTPPPLSSNQVKLAALLKQQAAAANDVSEEGEARYAELMAAISQVQGAIMNSTGGNV